MLDELSCEIKSSDVICVRIVLLYPVIGGLFRASVRKEISGPEEVPIALSINDWKLGSNRERKKLRAFSDF